MGCNGNWYYAMSLIAAATEVADKMRYSKNVDVTEICRSYGVYFELMSDSEREEFLRMVESYVH